MPFGLIAIGLCVLIILASVSGARDMTSGFGGLLMGIGCIFLFIGGIGVLGLMIILIGKATLGGGPPFDISNIIPVFYCLVGGGLSILLGLYIIK